jgi:hypothetical protein
MQRQRWFEIHDHPWFPGFLRDVVTDSLEAVWNTTGVYRPIVPRLREALRATGSNSVIDLCSGGGGPWPGLRDEVAAGVPLTVRLTDRYPNARLLARLTGSASSADSAVSGPRGITAQMEPVDARAVPAELRGFRTVFSAFHHFDPDVARAILTDAFARRKGIAIFEGARRNAWTMTATIAVPFLALREAALARPARFSRILWTWILPVVPFVLWIDGILSCLRSYSLNDLRELIAGLAAPDYTWQVGDERGGRVPIRYLIGTPFDAGSSDPQTRSATPSRTE